MKCPYCQREFWIEQVNPRDVERRREEAEHDEWLESVASRYRGDDLDKLLDELFPVAVGVEALKQRKAQRSGKEK